MRKYYMSNSFYKISVIVPVYNQEKYIQCCIDSILNQTLKDIEICIIDDFSTDNSLSIINKYYSGLSNTKIIHNTENKGLSISRNIGIKNTSDEFIVFIDSDDFIDKNFLEVLYFYAKKHNADVVSMGYKNVIENNNNWITSTEIKTTNTPYIITNDLESRLIAMCQKKFIANAWCKILKRSFIYEYNLYFDKIISEDVLFNFLLLYYSTKYIVIPDALYNYRQTKNSITRCNDISKISSYLKNNIYALRYVQNYICRMEKIKNNYELCIKIKNFFCEILFDYLFFKICNGQNLYSIFNIITSTLDEFYNNDAFFMAYIMKKYIVCKISKK